MGSVIPWDYVNNSLCIIIIIYLTYLSFYFYEFFSGANELFGKLALWRNK